MATKQSLKTWIVEALEEAGGTSHHVRIAEHIWCHHKDELEQSGDLFYTWQYDLRWAGQNLRKEGVLAKIDGQGDGTWSLSRRKTTRKTE